MTDVSPRSPAAKAFRYCFLAYCALVFAFLILPGSCVLRESVAESLVSSVAETESVERVVSRIPDGGVLLHYTVAPRWLAVILKSPLTGFESVKNAIPSFRKRGRS